MIVTLSELKRVLDFIDGINKVPFENIEWIHPTLGKIEVSPQAVQEWKFLGLNNSYFAKSYLMNPPADKRIDTIYEKEEKE